MLKLILLILFIYAIPLSCHKKTTQQTNPTNRDIGTVQIKTKKSRNTLQYQIPAEEMETEEPSDEPDKKYKY